MAGTNNLLDPTTPHNDALKQKQDDLLSPREKEREANFWKPLQEDDSPWAARAKVFCGPQPEIKDKDLTLKRAPKINSSTEIIKLEESDIKSVFSSWGLCLAERFAGRFPGKDAVQTLVRRWPCEVSVTYHSRR